MLGYERRVVGAMITTDDARIRAEVIEFAGGSLAAMPELLRFGISGISVALAGWSALRRLAGAGRSPVDELAWLEAHPVGLVRQWVRALRSLVLFSEHEKLEAAGIAAVAPVGT